MSKPYVAEAMGKLFSVDGGENNYRGKNGVIGEFETAEEATAAAKKEKTETCTVRVMFTRDPDGLKIIYEDNA